MEKYVIFQGKKIAYQVSGSGRSIVLLHGFLEDRSIWDQFSETLSPHYQIVTVDLPGFGQSENLSDVHTMALMAKAVNEVLVAEDIKHCILVGHSMGGYVAIELAAKFADKLSGLVFFHSHVAADGDEARINRYRAIELVKNNKKQFISSFIPLLFAEKNINRFAKEIARLQQRSDAISAESVMASLAGMAVRNDRQELLGNLEIPVLFIIGKQDSRIPMDKSMPQVQLPRHSEAIILSEVGHMGFLEEKEKTCTVLANFAARIL